MCSLLDTVAQARIRLVLSYVMYVCTRKGIVTYIVHAVLYTQYINHLCKLHVYKYMIAFQTSKEQLYERR